MTEHPLTRPSPYTGDEMRAMLVAGAKYEGYLYRRAAVHLLTFTDLPAWRGFHANLVDIERVHSRDLDRERLTVARVRDWTALLAMKAAQSSSSGRRLLALAVSMARGEPVDLRESLSGLGHAHARRVLEAVAIATGADEFYTLTPTPKLAELEAFHAEMRGSPAPAQSGPADAGHAGGEAAACLAALRALYVGLADGPPVNGDWLLGELGRLTRDASKPAGPDAAASYDWTRYERTCDPDRQLDGLGDLALFLGGSEDSFTGKLLALIAKAQSTPANMAALEQGFPREVTAWRAWMQMSPSPTAAELCATLTGGDA